MTRARFNRLCCHAGWLALFLTACGKKKIQSARGKPAPRPAKIGSVETGVASWYGHPYDGRQAADGEIYDMETLVAAHRTLPFNTWVRVTNQNNGKSVEVRIIDRGPFVGGRIIDLSHAAAQVVDMIGTGTAKVRVVVIKAPEKAPERPAERIPNPVAQQPALVISDPDIFGVQVGVFANRANADRVASDMQTRYGSARLISRQGDTTMWRVVVGHENSEEDAEALAVKIRGAENLPQAFVVRVDSK